MANKVVVTRTDGTTAEFSDSMCQVDNDLFVWIYGLQPDADGWVDVHKSFIDVFNPGDWKKVEVEVL